MIFTQIKFFLVYFVVFKIPGIEKWLILMKKLVAAVLANSGFWACN